MRPLTVISCLLLAAVGGGVTAQLLTPTVANPAPATAMMEQAAELYRWLESGAHFYVCGDAKRMAKDVDEALHQIIEKIGGKTRDEAAAYVTALKQAKRYQRDVY